MSSRFKVDAYEGWTSEGHTWWEVGTPEVSGRARSHRRLMRPSNVAAERSVRGSDGGHCDDLRQNSFLVVGRAGMDLYADPPGTSVENAQISPRRSAAQRQTSLSPSEARRRRSLITAVSDDAVGRFTSQSASPLRRLTLSTVVTVWRRSRATRWPSSKPVRKLPIGDLSQRRCRF